MRFFVRALSFLLLSSGGASVPTAFAAGTPAQAPGGVPRFSGKPAALQAIPRIAIIDLYGLRKVGADRVRAALEVKEGDPLPASKEEAEERIEKLPGVVRARLEAVCCVAGNASLFVGIEERGAIQFAVRSEPAGAALLPERDIDTYRQFLTALGNAAGQGKTDEDLTAGHALAAEADTRELQQKFLTIARERLGLLREVLRESADEEHRAAAAYIIGYAPDKRQVLNDLQSAMQDPDAAVRSNAMRALKAIAVLSIRNPEREIHVPGTWFIEMLNSILLSDRYRAALALETLTEKRPASDLEYLRERALPSIVEMARWKTLDYALPAFILAGRLAGLSEEAIQAAWKSGDRKEVVEEALASARKKK